MGIKFCYGLILVSLSVVAHFLSINLKLYVCELLVNSPNILSSSGQTIKFMRPQQNIQKINPSVPPLAPRTTQSTTVNVQVRFVLICFFFYLVFCIKCINN